jgi:hypothetical protein
MTAGRRIDGDALPVRIPPAVTLPVVTTLSTPLRARVFERLVAEWAGRTGTQRPRPAGVLHPQLRPWQGTAREGAQLLDGHDRPVLANERTDAALGGVAQLGEDRNAKAAVVAEFATGRKGLAERQHFGTRISVGAQKSVPLRPAASLGSLGTGDGHFDTGHDLVEDLLAHRLVRVICFPPFPVSPCSTTGNPAGSF